MKKIYLIRHGQSEGNIGKKTQTAEEPLTEKGIEQAKMVAERFKDIDFDILLSSTHLRAIQTAEEISNVSGKKIFPTELLMEAERPSKQLGLLRDSEEYKKIQKHVDNSFLTGERYEDGESTIDLVERAKEFLNFIDHRDEEVFVAVTHGWFLGVIAANVLLGEQITPPTCYSVMNILRTTNTGITVIEKDLQNRWRLTTWNDTTHI